MKIHAYMILHYGCDYVSYALRSIYPQVEQIHILYTPRPTHGHSTKQPLIETRKELQAAVAAYDPECKVAWYDVENVSHEGQHRDLAIEVCRKAGAEMILVLDYDEIWHSYTLENALKQAQETNNAREWRINFTHFWRSFDWVCRDQGWPARILDLRHDEGIGYISKSFGEIYHFGYAIRDEVMRYKWQIHGHKSELRPNWLTEKWDVWPPPLDCHPTNGKDFWTPERFSKSDLPELMRSHPFYELGKIEFRENRMTYYVKSGMSGEVICEFDNYEKALEYAEAQGKIAPNWKRAYVDTKKEFSKWQYKKVDNEGNTIALSMHWREGYERIE